MPTRRSQTTCMRAEVSPESLRIRAANSPPTLPRAAAAVPGVPRWSLAENSQSVSPACTAASISRSAAASRCHRRRSNSVGDMPGGGSWSRIETSVAARTMVRRSRRMVCRQPMIESSSSGIASSPEAASVAHQAVTASRNSRSTPRRKSAASSIDARPSSDAPPGPSTSIMPPSTPSSAESRHTIDS